MESTLLKQVARETSAALFDVFSPGLPAAKREKSINKLVKSTKYWSDNVPVALHLGPFGGVRIPRQPS